MIKIKSLAIILVTTILICYSQSHAVGQESSVPEQTSLSPIDLLPLAKLPEISHVPVIKSNQLPYKLDNSTQAYFRNIIEQVDSECGQISGIAYNFTYEIDRLRGLPATSDDNQYPTHFTYNFMNGGYGWHGVSYFHCFEILRTLGCPNVETYGGISEGGPGRWMTGYDAYYSAMKNRIKEACQIQVGTPEGLMLLKHWLHNHLDGSPVGGVASFYANSPWNLKTLPEGSPEEGKHVITKWQGLPSHAMTVVGYNDSIRYDYNADGIFTNDLDINNDGEVDMRDWEIGGLLFADGWNGGINFGDSGKCYMMYKTLAEKVYEGGIWNHAMHVLYAKKQYDPLLTAKITLKHTNRECLKVRCGVSKDLTSNQADYLLDFPVVDYQGGSQYMQGGTDLQENKTIEFGLDITPLVSYLEIDQAAKIFLHIEERDPNSQGVGEIINFSVIDYTSNPQEYHWEGSNLSLNNNDITTVSTAYTYQGDKVKITTDELPMAVVGDPYAVQLEAEGGEAPYKWYLLNHYEEYIYQDEPENNGNYFEPDNWNYGLIIYPLSFSFPFYGNSYDTLYIYPDGFIMPYHTQNPWPYLYDERLFIKSTPCIAPFACQKLDFIPAFGHGIWIKEHEDSISIRWKADIDNNTHVSEIDFGLRLNKQGEVKFIYNTSFDATEVGWSCGISDGTKMNHHFPEMEAWQYVDSSDAVRIKTSPLPGGLSMDDDGMLSGVPDTYHYGLPLRFCVEDNNRVLNEKLIHYSSSGFGVDDPSFEHFELVENYFPNPFHHKLTIRLNKENHKAVDVYIYNEQGKLIKKISAEQASKTRNVYWHGDDMNGNLVSSGIYFINCVSQHKSELKKVIWMPNN